MADTFQFSSPSLITPATHAAAVTPNDSADLGYIAKGIIVGVSGNVAVILAEDSSAVTLPALVAGVVHPIRAKRVMSTNTTATSIVAVW